MASDYTKRYLAGKKKTVEQPSSSLYELARQRAEAQLYNPEEGTVASDYTRRYLAGKKKQERKPSSLHEFARQQTEVRLPSHKSKSGVKFAVSPNRVNKLDVQDERAYQSKKRSSFSERMKTAGSSSVLDQMKSFDNERRLVRQYERDKREKIVQTGPDQTIDSRIRRGLAYGTERAGATLLGAAEGLTDTIGAGIYGTLAAASSLGGLAPNAVSDWAIEQGEAFLDNSITRDFEKSIEERYNPTQVEQMATGVGQAVTQMLPAIGVSKWLGAARGVPKIASAAKGILSGEQAGQLLFGLQVAGNSASQAKQEGADFGESLAYGVSSGLMESLIERVSGGIPGLGNGFLDDVAARVASNPIVLNALDILGEGGEEAVSAILDPYIRRAIYDPDAENATPEEIAESAVTGALAAGILKGGLELPSFVSDRFSARSAAKSEMVPPSATRIDILYQLAQDMANDRLGGVKEDKVSVAPRPSNPYTVYTQGPQPAQKVNPARDPAMVDYIAETLGKNGSVSMRRLYDGEMDTDAYSAEFLESYSAGMRGDEKPAPQSLTPAQSEAAYVAGQADRKGKAAAPIGRQTGGDIYGRTEEALVGRHEARGYDPGGAGGPVLRERGAAQTGDSRANRGNAAIPAGRPGPAGAGEAGREVTQTARSWQEDPAAFTARSTERGGVVRQMGSVSVAYRETEPARWSSHTRETVEAFREFGIEPHVVDFLERNSNGYTSRSEEAVTSPEGEVYLVEGSGINGRQVAAHEALHKGLREGTPEALAFRESVLEADFSDQMAQEAFITIQTEYFDKRGRVFDPSKDMDKLYEEFAAYISGFLGDGSAREQLGAAYADFDALERQWQAMKEAMKHGSGQLYSEEHGQAMQQVQAPAGENGELQTIPGLDTGRGADRGRVPGVREEGNEGVKRSLESPEAAARQVRRLQKRGADAKMEATRHSLKEDMVYGGAREESRESFYARGREGTGGGFTVVERGPYACAYRGVARVQESAARVRQSLQAWGIDSAVVDGPVYVNKGGVTTARPVREAATIQGMVFISNGTTIPPLDTAGHEAYHAWKGTSARTDYTDTVRENLNYGGREFLTYQQKIADAYFGGDVELSDVVQLRKFEEELFAYISGHLNCGDYESTLRAMFRDYDAVKAAWEKLVIYMREVTEYGTGQLYSEEQHGRVQQVQEVQEGNLQMREVPGVDSAPEAGGNVPGLRAEGDHRPRKDWQGTREEVKRGTADFQYDQRAPGHEIDRFAVLGKEGGERWSAQRLSSGTDGKRPMPLSDLIGKIRHDFGISITTGHIRGSKTRGRYNRADQGIRTKIANDLPTVSHELGHHLDNLYGLTQNLKPGPQAELIDNLDQGMKDAYPKKKWATEGLAEFVRRFLQNRETAAIDYPQFTEHFLSSMKNTDGPIIEQFADEINAYYALDTSTATSSVRLAEERGMDFRTIKEKAKEMGDDIYQAWVDSNHAIKRFDERAGSNVYLFATNSAYSDSMAGQILTGDLTDRNGQYVAPGLKTALSGVNLKNKSEYRAFGEYLIVRHGPERLKEGLRVFADDRKNSTNWMEGRQAELEEQYPAFKEAADRLYQFESDFLRTWGVETGLVSGKSADEWEERWKYYVPFNRAMDKQRAGAKKGYANQSSGIKKAIGSGLDIVHPVDNIVFNVTRMVNAGVRNNVMKELTSAAQRSGGMADFLEKVPMPLQRKSYDATKLKGGLKQSIEESSMSQEDKDAAFDIVENIDDILYQYGRGKAGGDVVTVMKGGKLEYWKINDKSLLSSITAMSPAKLPAVLEAYGAVSRFMTGNITGNNLLWSIFSNSPRDMMTLFTYSKDKNPLKLFGGVMSTYANQMKGQNADPLFKEYLAMGGGKSSAYTADRSLAKRTRKKLTNKSALEWLNPMEALSAVSDSIEMGPRFAYYKILRQKGVSPQQAFYESADITTNFRRRGTNSQALNKFIPFFNASVQGLDKFSRWIRATEVPSDKRAKVVRVRTTAYILSSALLAALIYGINNRDDESEKEYEQLSNYTKNAYWAIPIGDGKFFTIPKPREIAVLSSFFETLAEYFYGDNRHAFDGFYDYASENFLPTGASDVAKMDLYGFIGSLGLIGVGANMMANRDFMGRPIVSAGLQSLEPKDQYTNRTSAIAKAVGGAFNQSPQMIDYFFGQTLGGWWKMQKALFPVDGSQRDLTLGIQGTYVKDNQYSIDLLNWLYDKADASAAVSKSDPGNTEKAIESKWDSNMTTFYSRYNKLSKDKSETTATRATRQTVLDMILEYQKAYDSGTKTAGQKAVEAVCKSAGTTEYLPSVVQSTIKDEKEQSHTLSAAQYVEYQGEYLRLYWEAVEEALPSAKTQSEKEKVLKYAKSVAADTAKARALRRIGADYDRSSADNGGLSVGDVARFEAAYSQAKGEIDEDTGETIPGTKQEEVIEALENMSWLTDEERDYLFSTKYTSDKNNPWAGMAPDEEEEISIEAKDEAVNRLLSGIYW